MDERWLPTEGELVGLTELRQRIHRSRQRASQLAGRPGFPEPIAVLHSGRIWFASDIEKWIQDHRPDLA